MKGARVGEFDVTELFECLKVEYDADRVFMQANDDIGRMFEHRDANEGVKGLDEMLQFIFVMATDKEERHGQLLCPAFHAEGLDYTDLKKIGELQKNPETTMQVQKRHFTFNHQDLDHEAEWMAREYAEANIVGFGYALGDTLAKHDGSGAEGEKLFLY